MSPLAKGILRAFAHGRRRVLQPGELSELVASGLVVVDVDSVVLTAKGARELAALLERDERARRCRCGDNRAGHSDHSPHPCLACGACESFTAAEPLATEAP
jgi:hypothetical protein